MRLFKMSLTFQMAIATVLGILVGLFLGDICEFFSPWASAYIMILKITAVPYLIVAIMHGVGQLGISQGKNILKKGIFFICLAWAINLAVIYLINGTFPQGKSTSLGGYVSTEPSNLNFAELLIPDNIFYDLSTNIVPAVVIFSLLIGIALMHIKEKQTIMYWLENWVQSLTNITGWIARITPYGTFIIIANQIGTIQLSTVKQVSTYIILYILGLSLIIFWVFPRLTSMLTSIPSYRWLQQLFPILLLAYTTNVVIVCLPYIIELLKKETSLLDPHDDKAQSQIQGTVSVVFNLPLGSLFISVFVLFISIFYNIPLSAGGQVELFVTTFLTSLGAVGLGSWINSLTFILDSLGLPIDAVNLFLTTLPFTSGFQSMLSAMQIASLSLFITLACRKMIVFHWKKALQNGVLTAIPVLLIFGGIKFFNPLPPIQSETKSIYELDITSNIPVKITPPGQAPVPPSSIPDDTFAKIINTKTLRVGYNPSTVPFCFYNIDKKVVGYDIAFAYELAYDLGCKLELVPMDYSKLTDELNSNLYDIAMSAVSITEKRLRAVSFTESYMTPRLVFVVSDDMRSTFSSLEKLHERKELSIAVVKGTAFVPMAKELFPDHKIVLIDNYNAFHNNPNADALFWEEQEAIAWTLCHRKYRVVFPQPPLGLDSLGYAVRMQDSRFLHFLNQWLNLKKTSGYTQKQYDLWIKGKTEIAAQPEPRWSIIRNVLHWIE